MRRHADRERATVAERALLCCVLREHRSSALRIFKFRDLGTLLRLNQRGLLRRVRALHDHRLE